LLIRYGVADPVLIDYKFYEANGIKPFVENSPFMSWMYSVWSVQAASNVIEIEVASAVLIAADLGLL